MLKLKNKDLGNVGKGGPGRVKKEMVI